MAPPPVPKPQKSLICEPQEKTRIILGLPTLWSSTDSSLTSSPTPVVFATPICLHTCSQRQPNMGDTQPSQSKTGRAKCQGRGQFGQDKGCYICDSMDHWAKKCPKRALGKLVGSKPDLWDEYLDAGMFGLRTKKQITIKYSPYFLMFGREARYPSEVPLDSNVEAVVGEESPAEEIKRLESIRDIVKANVGRQQASMRRRLKSERFKVKVLISREVTVWSFQKSTLTNLLGKAKNEVPRIPRKIKSSKVSLPSTAPAPQTNRPSVIQFNISTKSAPPDAPASLHLAVSLASPAPSPPAAPTSSPPAASLPSSTSTSPASLASSPPAAPELQTEKYVQEAWAGKKAHVFLSKIEKYTLYYWDIERTSPNQELESEVINAYLTLLVREYNKCNEDAAAVIDSFSVTAIWQGKSPRLRTLDAMAYSVVMGIVNDHHHWMLMVMYSHDKRCLFIDPLGESQSNIKRCQESTRAFVRKKRLQCIEVGLQHPASCTPTRWHLMWCPGLKNDLSNLCHSCGLEENDNDNHLWICCDMCKRWFHHGCVGTPNIKGDYQCPACE
ncbi:uncharacterized protein LOC144012223 [Festucalex cinctus]